MRIGIVFGCFIPLHTGHMTLIDKCIAESEKTIIAVCGKRNDRGKDYLPFDVRIELIKKKYQSDKVIVVVVDDEKIGLDGTFTLDNWKRWGEELFANAGIDPINADNTFVWYTGEPGYKDKLGAIYQNHEICLVDRSIDGISGTKIRQDTDRYLDKIAPEFLEYLNKRKR